jgi:RNA polymerase sigma factor (sigma-70 family)
MAEVHANKAHVALLYHFCRLRLPGVLLPLDVFHRQLERAYELFGQKPRKESSPGHGVTGAPLSWPAFLTGLHTLDFFLACACLEGKPAAWEALFNSRASRTESLLVDALRSRAVRLFPRDPERQDEAVSDFWGYLIVPPNRERARKRDAPAILARYDGQRPLVPWLICVFHNKLLSELRDNEGLRPLPDLDPGDADFELPLSAPGSDLDGRWHDEFRAAAHEWFGELNDREVLLLGLRLRYRLSQREVAGILGIHEGNVSKHTAKVRDRCLERIGQHLRELGWTGDDLTDFILKEMDSVLLEEPRLALDRLAALLAARGLSLPTNITPPTSLDA